MSRSDCPQGNGPCLCTGACQRPDNRITGMAPRPIILPPVSGLKIAPAPKSDLVRRLEAESATRHVRDTKAELFSDLLGAIEEHKNSVDTLGDQADDSLYEAALVARAQLKAAKAAVGL